jgi:hypothetical protein
MAPTNGKSTTGKKPQDSNPKSPSQKSNNIIDQTQIIESISKQTSSIVASNNSISSAVSGQATVLSALVSKLDEYAKENNKTKSTTVQKSQQTNQASLANSMTDGLNESISQNLSRNTIQPSPSTTSTKRGDFFGYVSEAGDSIKKGLKDTYDLMDSLWFRHSRATRKKVEIDNERLMLDRKIKKDSTYNPTAEELRKSFTYIGPGGKLLKHDFSSLPEETRSRKDLSDDFAKTQIYKDAEKQVLNHPKVKALNAAKDDIIRAKDIFITGAVSLYFKGATIQGAKGVANLLAGQEIKDANAAWEKLQGEQSNMKGLETKYSPAAATDLKERIEDIKGATEKLKTETFTIDPDSTVGNAIKTVEQLTLQYKNTLSDINSVYYKLFEGFKGFQTKAHDNIKQLGIYQDIYANSVTQNLESIAYLYRARTALQLNEKDLENILRISILRNKSWSSSLETVRSASKKAADTYNVSLAEVRKGANVLRKDFVHFGHMSEESITNLVARMRTLGIEVSGLAGVMDKYKTFDNAATAASKLNQAFGMNIDAMRLMKAESPEEIIDMMRQSLLNTGSTFDQLSWKQKDYLVSASGLSKEMWMSMGHFNDKANLSFKDRQKQIQKENDVRSNAMKKRMAAMRYEEQANVKVHRKTLDTILTVEDAKERAQSKALLRNKKSRDALHANVKSKQETELQLSGAAGDPRQRQLLDQSYSRMEGLINRLTKLRASQTQLDLGMKYVQAYAGEAIKFDEKFKVAYPKQYKKMLEESKKAIDDIGKLEAEYQLKLRLDTKKFRMNIMAMAAQSVLPTLDLITNQVAKDLDSYTDGSGKLSFEKVIKKLNLPQKSLAKNLQHANNVFRSTGKGAMTIFQTFGAVVSDIVSAAAGSFGSTPLDPSTVRTTPPPPPAPSPPPPEGDDLKEAPGATTTSSTSNITIPISFILDDAVIGEQYIDLLINGISRSLELDKNVTNDTVLNTLGAGKNKTTITINAIK